MLNNTMKKIIDEIDEQEKILVGIYLSAQKEPMKMTLITLGMGSQNIQKLICMNILTS